MRSYDAMGSYDWTYWNAPFPDTINFGVMLGKKGAPYWKHFHVRYTTTFLYVHVYVCTCECVHVYVIHNHIYIHIHVHTYYVCTCITYIVYVCT